MYVLVEQTFSLVLFYQLNKSISFMQKKWQSYQHSGFQCVNMRDERVNTQV